MIKTYSDADVKALLGYYNGKTYLQVRNKTLIMILVETGIRNNELCNIKLEDVYDRKHGSVRGEEYNLP